MGDGMTLEIDGFKELAAKAGQLTPEVKKDLNKTMLVAALMVENAAKRNVQDKFNTKSGEFVGSIGHKLHRIQGFVQAVTVGTNIKYGSIHELGGTIEPRDAQWLTIPMPGITGYARDYQNTFFAISKNNNLVLFQNEGGSVRPLFVLKKSIEIPARPYLGPALNENAAHLTKLIGDAVKRGLRRVSGK